MNAKFKVTRIWIINGQSHAELKGEDGFISLHWPASDNLTVGQEVVLQPVVAANEVPVMNLNPTRAIRLPEPVNREELARERNDLLSEE